MQTLERLKKNAENTIKDLEQGKTEPDWSNYVDFPQQVFKHKDWKSVIYNEYTDKLLFSNMNIISMFQNLKQGEVDLMQK